MLHFEDGNGEQLATGDTNYPYDRDEDGSITAMPVECITVVAIVPPRHVYHIAHNRETHDDEEYRVTKLAIEMKEHPDPNATPQLQFNNFPLGGEGPYLCTQGMGGSLTHFFAASYHAIDFRCDEGTPLLAVADGVVTDVQDDNTN